MISKELLNKVLPFGDINSLISYGLSSDGNILLQYEDTDEIVSIYELAHKCKEWAYNNSYTLRSQLKVCYCRFPIHNDIEEKIFKADTEPEAIFKACQWILENK